MKQQTKIQLQYSGVQALYCVTCGLMVAYASVFLQARGIPNRVIGLILGIGMALSALLQPLLAAMVDRWGIPLTRGLAAVQVLVALLSVTLYGAPLSNGAVGLLMICTISLNSAQQAGINSLTQILQQKQLPVNFGMARAAGSFFYAAVMAIAGQVLQKVNPSILPLSYLTTTILNLLLIQSIGPLRDAVLVGEAQKQSAFPSVKAYPFFWIFLASVLCLGIGEGMVSNFLLQIMQNVGGDSGSVGLAVGIAAGLEVPSMMLNSRMSRKFGVRKLLVFCTWIWALKLALIFLARSPEMIMAAYSLQFFSFAIYIPSSMEFVQKTMPGGLFLKSHTLTCSAYSLGCVLAALIGGMLIDGLGVHSTLFFITCSVTLGAILMTLGVRSSRQA